MSQKLIISIIAIVFLQGCESVPDVRNLVSIDYTPFHQSELVDIKDKKIEITLNDETSSSNLVRKTYKDFIKDALTINGFNVTDEIQSAEIFLSINIKQPMKAQMIGSYEYGYSANGWVVSGSLYNAKELRIILDKNKNENADLKISDSRICLFKGKILSPIGVDTADIIKQFVLFSSSDFFSASGKTRETYIPIKIFKD